MVLRIFNSMFKDLLICLPIFFESTYVMLSDFKTEGLEVFFQRENWNPQDITWYQRNLWNHVISSSKKSYSCFVSQSFCVQKQKFSSLSLTWPAAVRRELRVSSVPPTKCCGKPPACHSSGLCKSRRGFLLILLLNGGSEKESRLERLCFLDA